MGEEWRAVRGVTAQRAVASPLCVVRSLPLRSGLGRTVAGGHQVGTAHDNLLRVSGARLMTYSAQTVVSITPDSAAPPDQPPRRAPKHVELPFRVRIARTEEQLQKAVEIRAEAYTRHLPALGNALRSTEHIDLTPDCLVFLAESKSDELPVGTMRIQTNFHAPLPMEESIHLPTTYSERPLAAVSRLAVKAGPRGKMVKLALFKAMHRYCIAKQVEWVLIGARPPLEETYLALDFADVFPDQQLRPLATAKNLPHRILAFEVATAERRWHAIDHPLYKFMINRFHPDIEIFNSVSNRWHQPRVNRNIIGHDGPPLDTPVV